jgi:hypothetical protein
LATVPRPEAEWDEGSGGGGERPPVLDWDSEERQRRLPVVFSKCGLGGMHKTSVSVEKVLSINRIQIRGVPLTDENMRLFFPLTDMFPVIDVHY